METVDVLVKVWDRGQNRQAIVPVEVEAILTSCWRPIAAIKAAVELEMPFTTVMEKARFGFRKEDIARIFPNPGRVADSAMGPSGARNDTTGGEIDVS